MTLDATGSVRLVYDEEREELRATSIIGLETFNAARALRDWLRMKGITLQDKRRDITTSAGEAVIPETASTTELARIADRYLGIRTLAPFENERQRALYRLHIKLQKLESHQERLISITSALAEQQQEFLLSGFCYSHKRILTYDAVASQFPWSERTTRRCIQTLRITWRNTTFRATDLMCSSELGTLCAHIAALRAHHPTAGAPRIRKLLDIRGITASQRQVGKAIKYLERPSIARLQQELDAWSRSLTVNGDSS